MGVEFVIRSLNQWLTQACCQHESWEPAAVMKNVLLIPFHLPAVVAKLLGLGGIKGIIAEHLLLKQQLIVVCRPRQRAPNLLLADRFLLGFFS